MPRPRKRTHYEVRSYGEESPVQKGFTVVLPSCFYQRLIKREEKGKAWSIFLRRKCTEGREKTMKVGRWKIQRTQ